MNFVAAVRQNDKRSMEQVAALLSQEGLCLDKHLDYTCAIYDDNYHVIATGSCFKNTLRCFAVSKEHQGEGLLAEILAHLIELECAKNYNHLFLYSKSDSAKFFGDLGFYAIEVVDKKLVFMENQRHGFADYLRNLQQESPAQSNHSDKKIGAIVLNANPFTYGHQYLIEYAAKSCDALHLFVVSEDASIVPFAVRKKLVEDGTSHLDNIIYHDTGCYIISSATFPSYFLKDEEEIIRVQAQLDVRIFNRIAQTLGIGSRFVGEEPNSFVTNLYNEAMAKFGSFEQIVIPRKQAQGKAISASAVRALLQQGDWAALKELVPESTLAYFQSAQAQELLEIMRGAGDLVHY